MADPITTLGLCAGVGWLDESVAAGCRYFGWGHRTVGYVERDAYAANVLLARMEESSMEPAPVWGGNLESFRGRAFRGKVDGIVAGFPCQPWSNAGQRKGTEDDRWLWPAIVRIIDDVEPGFVFLENVAALIAGGGLEYVLSDLAKMGFDAEWACCTAEAVGAAHRRERVFILAHDPSKGGQLFFGGNGRASGAGTGEVRAGGIRRQQRTAVDEQPELRNSELDDATGARLTQEVGGANQRIARQRSRERLPGDGRGAVADSERYGLGGCGRETAVVSDERCHRPVFAPGPSANWGSVEEYLWPATQRGFRVLVDGCPVVLDEGRADQLRCGGNGVVALCGAVAFVELVRRALKCG